MKKVKVTAAQYAALGKKVVEEELHDSGRADAMARLRRDPEYQRLRGIAERAEKKANWYWNRGIKEVDRQFPRKALESVMMAAGLAKAARG